jgi:hypothetical protein
MPDRMPIVRHADTAQNQRTARLQPMRVMPDSNP